MPRVVQINLWQMQIARFSLARSPMLPDDSDSNQHEPKEKEYGENDERDDSHVRLRLFCHCFEQNKKQDQTEAYDGNDSTDESNDVIERLWEYALHKAASAGLHVLHRCQS
jgi:hypothetical protein